MRRSIVNIQYSLLLTKHEALVVIWLSALITLGTLGSAIFPTKAQHHETDARVLIRHLDSITSPDTASIPVDNNREGRDSPPAPKSKLVNLNTASAHDLDAVPGIGPATAQRIIDRRKLRRYASPEDLLDVKGIGKKKLEKMRPYIIAP